MGFKTQSVRAWQREWRESAWRETVPLSHGRECPECFGTICGGKSWRAHALKEQQDAEMIERMDAAIQKLFSIIRILATEAGHADWYPPVATEDEDQEETPPLDGFVIGSGELPPETRGGSE